MANFDDLIDFDEYSNDGIVNDPLEGTDLGNLTQPSNDSDSDSDIVDDTQDTQEDVSKADVIDKLLAEKGFDNPDKISITNEFGEEEFVAFDDLTEDEKFQILNSPDADLTDEELRTINFLRSNNTTLEDVIEHNKKVAVSEALSRNQDSFIVDQASDEQLFMADLRSKYPSFTDEELEDELEKEMDSPNFDKKVAILREQYKQLEEQDRQEQQIEAEKAAEDQYNQVAQALLEVAQNTDDLYSLELEDQDKDDVLRFLLDKDVNGQSEFYKLLNNPKALFDIAWFALKGDEAFNTIHQYYKRQIDNARHGSKTTTNVSKSPRVRRKSGTTPSDDKYDMADYFK